MSTTLFGNEVAKGEDETSKPANSLRSPINGKCADYGDVLYEEAHSVQRDLKTPSAAQMLPSKFSVVTGTIIILRMSRLSWLSTRRDCVRPRLGHNVLARPRCHQEGDKPLEKGC